MVELLVAIAIVIVLAALIALVSRKGMNRARAVQCIGQMRELVVWQGRGEGDFEGQFGRCDIVVAAFAP